MPQLFIGLMNYNQLQFEGCFKNNLLLFEAGSQFFWLQHFIFTHSILFKNLVSPACKEKNITTFLTKVLR
jgi:hypothetical protein